MSAPGGAEGGDGGPGNFARRDLLLKIQEQQQALWDEERIFEAEPPAEGEPYDPDAKFFGNFPYPYMNGLLHLGHAFSLSKLEFAAAYHRLNGKRVLFPQGFHCTGMPIKACADKLDREIREHGCPPVYPSEEEQNEAAAAVAAAPAAAASAAAAAADKAAAASAAADKDPTKFAGKKSKVQAKKGPGATQWQILRQSGISDDEIPAFRDPAHWLRYFPPRAMEDIRALGCGVDWRRSFVTTDMNPYYDSFVRWQMRTLRAQGRVVKDKRYAVYSPLDGQPCADHDRATGEGVGPQEYTLIKLRALPMDEGSSDRNDLAGPLAAVAAQSPGGVFLLAATLRPETMYGQTNAWVLPEGEYGAFEGLEGEAYVCTKRAALNLSYQERLPESARGAPRLLAELKGQDLIGLRVAAPNAPSPVRVLPLLTILTNKGTGVVTSVPSDSPDDYTALCDLQKKPKLREKFGVADEWGVEALEPVHIIDIPGFEGPAAPAVCAQLKITSQNEAAKLAEAKGMVYLKGFTDGVMAIGPHKGTKVSEAKPKIRDEMIAAGQAFLYSEPERPVTSRSGDDCVVALTDQWYLTYGEDQWRDEALAALRRLDTFSGEARHAFEHTLGWLQQWACSRSFGLGTRLPWDEQFLVESLSDSTVYMAYYSVAHILQGGDMYGEGGGPSYDAFRKGGGTGGAGAGGSGGPAIPAAAMTHEAWDYVFLAGPYPKDCAVPEATLKAMRREFEFWYPFDLRVSGKDLIQNHLTFALYTHVAVWPRDRFPERAEQLAQRERLVAAGVLSGGAGGGGGGASAGGAEGAAAASSSSPDDLSAPSGRFWPRALRCNGHLLLNSEKMSKSTGNFKTLREAILQYGADATRWALADAGDGMDDANFETSTANAAILRLTKELAWLEETLLPPEERASASASAGGAAGGAGAAASSSAGGAAAADKAQQAPLREDGDGPDTVHDRVFANALAVASHRARQAYDRLLFREALKAAGYDLANARDGYRYACGPHGMRRSLVRRYAEVSCRLLAPITPHLSDHVWRRVLKREGSVLKAGWPGQDCGLSPEPDFVMERAAAYVEDLIPTLRKAVAKAEAPPKAKKGAPPAPAAAAPPKVKRGTLYVAERYVGWQEAVLRAMRACWLPSEGKLSADWTAKVLEAVKEAGAGAAAGGGDGAAADERRLKALALPFARFKAEEATRGGKAGAGVALDARLPFDEAALLRENLPYLLRALGGLEALEIAVVDLADEGGLPDAAKAAQPGAPAVAFAAE